MRTAPQYAPVDMPTKGVSINRSANKAIPYVYHIGKGYRNEYGKPTSKKVLIGKLDEEEHKLIPNARYFEIYGGTPQKQVDSNAEVQTVQDFGHYYLLDAIIHQYRLDEIMRNIFGDASEELLLLAIYTALEGSVLSYCEDWCENTYLFNNQRLTSQRISVLLNEVTEKKKADFFKAWMYAREPHEYFAYDVTSIYSYSRGNESVEYGYNRDKEALPQINLAMFYGEKSHLPIYYSSYPGSIPDKSHLKYMMRNAKQMGMRNVKYVMDNGFFSADNINLLLSEGHSFVLGMPGHMKYCRQLRKDNQQKIKDARYHLQTGRVQAMRFENTEYQKRIYVHMFYSTDKAAREEGIFYHELEKIEQGLLDGETPQGGDRYFVCTREENQPVHVERNYAAINDKLINFGYFFIATSDPAMSSAEALHIYRTKDVIEKNFDNLKNDIDMKRLRTHTLHTMDGKLFVAFLALILRAHVANVTAAYRAQECLSLDKIFIELKKLKVVRIGGCSLHNPMTKRQRDVLALFGCTEKDILACI